MEAYSVLMSIYHQENPAHVSVALESMMEQSVPTNDFVIVCDGPLTAELDNLLDSYAERYPDVIHLVRLKDNVGIGKAANIGLSYCKNDLVAKMDGDDISVKNRCEMQLARFEEKKELAVLGGDIDEFESDAEKPFSRRVVPKTNEAIRKFARRRQPFNNMTVMYRRSAVEKVGGYRDFRRSEDYDLYLRLLQANYYTENLDAVLVKARVDLSAFKRRASFETLKGCVRSRWYAFRTGYATLWDFLFCVCGETVILLSPDPLRHWIYNRFLRNK